MGQSSEHFRDTVPTWSGGPYLIDSVVAGERVVMVPNPRWYGEVQPTLERIVKEVVPATGWALAVQNGELDGGTTEVRARRLRRAAPAGRREHLDRRG